TNFSGDKEAWPIYFTIGNIKSLVWSEPTGHWLILLWLLTRCIAPLWRSFRAFGGALRKESIRECSQEGELIVFTNGYECLCFPVLSGWVADQPE
ncbi:hypothetical protein P167DRAFT_478190, partial [Morchella conica CCBAS932]